MDICNNIIINDVIFVVFFILVILFALIFLIVDGSNEIERLNRKIEKLENKIE